MRKVLKWTGIVALSPIVLFVLLFILLYIPPIQHFLREKATDYASEATGMKIGIERISLSFPLDLVIKGVKVVSKENTLLSVKRLSVKVQLLPLLQKRVEVDGVTLSEAFVNSANLIKGMKVSGFLGNLFIESHGVDLATDEAIIDKLNIRNSHLKLILNDTTTTPEDTTSTPINWKIGLRTLSLQNISLAMQLPQDSLHLSAKIAYATLSDGHIDLKEQAYRLANLSIKNSSVRYDMGYNPPINGFDPSHLALKKINIGIDSLKYHGDNMNAIIRELSFTERSGLDVISLKGNLYSDSTSIHIPDLKLKTLYSYINISALIDWNAISQPSTGIINALLSADIGKQDVMIITGGISSEFAREYPFRPLVIRAEVEGNLQELRLKELRGELPGAFVLTAKGKIEDLQDSLLRSANIEANLDTKNLNFVTSLMDASQRKLYTIPQDMNLRAKASMKGTLYETEVVFTEKGGKIELTGEYNGKNEIYTADLSIDSLQLHDFMPQDSLYSLTASLAVDGKGLDFLSPSTHLNANAAVHDFHYGMYDLSGIQLDAALSKSAALLTFNSNNKLFSLQARLNALLNKRKGEANLEINLSRLDFQELRITDKPFATSLLFSLNAKTDWKKAVSFTGNIRDIKFITQKKIFTPKNVDFNAATDKDSTFAYLQAGDLKLAFKSKEGIERLLQETSSFGEDLMSQLKERRIDQNELKQRLPGVRLRLTAGRNNPLSNYLAMSNISFKELLIDLSTTTGKGLSGDAHIYSMGLDSLQLDVIRLEISQDTTGVKFSGNLANNPGNKQVVFESWIEGGITEHGGELMFTYLDDKGETGVLLGLRAALRPNGVAFRFFPENPTIVFRPFHLNKDNYIFIGNDNRVSANLEMLDDKGTGLKLYSLPDTTALQDIGVELRRIELADVGEVIPYLPNITGLLSAEIHYTQTKTSLQVATEVRVDSLTYEKEKIGNMLLEAVYLPGNGDDHHLDAHLSHNGTEIVSAGGIYHTSGEGLLDANATLEHFPLNIANAFVPDHMAKLSGDMDGEMTVVGKLSHPKIDGQLILDDVAVYVPQAGARFRFDNRPLRVENNKLAFDHFSIFTKGTNPFTIDGEVDFSNLDAMTADLKMNAVNYELLNAPRTKESLIYGKVFVNFNSTVRGPLDALVMRGDVSLQGNTNVTYVLKDSPLTVQDRLGDLVTFVNFNDTTKATQEQPKIVALGGMDMLMTVHIDPAVQLKVDLSADRESRVELEGGGDLSLQYTPQGDLLLSGRYTLNSGLLKYSLPVFPAKTFTIQSGSYVNWTGNPMDPSLNITALERTRTSVTQDNQSPRMVNFDVVISVKNRLENLALVFNLEAPEDMAIQNQLSAMSAEERGKQAVTMLATGMYLAQTTSGKGGLDMGAALNSFLQNEISSIAGNALKTIDISVGMETVDGNAEDGSGKRTDYSFRFAKRFWNNRMSIIIGGRVSTGDNAQTNNQSFIDNISLEWRLDNSGTRYVKLFHDKNYESILEGEITETGVGVVLRKKMSRLGELFIFRKKKPIKTTLP